MKKRLREPKPLIPALASCTGPALIKYLASCNTTVRSQSLRLVISWLSSESQQLSDSDIKKLWKGLFYCLWHADKSPNQLALIDRLTSLFRSLQPELSLEFFRGFLVTLRREWPGIDRLRLDKFYLLIRRFMKALFELIRSNKWELDVLGEYFGVLEKDGFLAEDKLRGNGVNYHVVSVFLEELKGVGFPVRKEVINVVFGPFLAVLRKSDDRILIGKVKSCVFDELLKIGREMLSKKKMGVDCDEKDGNHLLGVAALRMGFSGWFYEVGSSEDCIQGNRKVALGLHQEFLKLEKDLESSGIEIAIPEYSDNGDDDVPQLIPIDFGNKDNVEKGANTENAGDEDQPKKKISKKNKKGKKEKDGENKKGKKEKDGEDVKRKKKKKRKGENKVSEVEENGDVVKINGSADIQSDDQESDGTLEPLSETVILNLQKQFEKVAAEMGSDSGDDSDFRVTPIATVKRNKRKRAKGEADQELGNPSANRSESGGVDAGTKSGKKVRFSMKNNLVWKPQNPLPPESLRLPPSVTPRGSALKKGVPPGPVVEMPLVKRKAKQKKKIQNRLRGAKTMMKRRKKVQTRTE